MKNRDSSGKFIVGIVPHNKGKRKEVDINYCKKKYLEGYSCFDICKKFNVSEATIRNRFKEIGFKLRKNNNHTKITKEKIRNTLISKGIKPKVVNRKAWNKGKPVSEKERLRLKQMRAKQVFPLKDSSIEVKIQNLLSQLHIEFYTHKYISEIRHAYQCDIFIPKQETEGIIIPKKIIIECDGCYWHSCPKCNKKTNKKQRKQIAKDNRRTKELKGKGFKVIRLWGHEIKSMKLNDLRNRL